MSDYSKKMMMYFGGANVMTCLAMARELGVIQLLLDSSKSVTSQEVADKLGLEERYVREILATLAVGEVVDVDDKSALFHVSDDNKSTLRDISVFSRVIHVYGERFTAVKGCIDKSGLAGVQYSDFPSMFSWLGDILVSIRKDMLDMDILPFIPEVAKRLESGIMVAEFGCAKGILLNQLAARFPNSTFLGSDVAMEQLNEARTQAASQNLQNVKYEIHDLQTLPESFNNTLDWIYTRDVIHDLPYPQKALNEIYRSLKSGGVFSMIDIAMSGEVVKEKGDPLSMFYYAASSFLCICESYQQPDSAALGAGWGIPLAREMVKTAGFTILRENISTYDPKERHYVCQK